MPFLTWINDKDARNQAKNVPFHILKNTGTYGDSSAENLLVHGDNLLALRALLPFYRGKVKCIYIDPPYNTGSAFEHYDDSLEHSKWLSMMYPRLELLRQFLAEDGSIFVSIDDGEGCYLKVLLDEVFGRKNFITTFIWKKVDSPNDNKVAICPDHEFIHCYAKDISFCEFKKMASESVLDAYSNRDSSGRLYRDRLLRKNGKNSLRTDRPTMWFPIVDPDGNEVYPIRDDGLEGRWACGRARVDELHESGLLIWQKRKKKDSDEMVWVPYSREFAPEFPVRPYMTIWSDVNTTRQAKIHHKSIFAAHEIFDTIKPEELIYRIFDMATNEGDLILDSFLGSGTTAAVAHKMGRRYIGIEMGEHAKTHCIPRLQKVIDGEQGGISASVNWQGGGGFRFFELGEPAFDKWGCINPEVDFKTLAAFVWMSETGEAAQPAETPFLGVSNGTAYYLLYAPEGSTSDPSAGVLTFASMQQLLKDHSFDGPKVVFAEACAGIAEQELKAHQITFKQIPTDLLR